MITKNGTFKVTFSLQQQSQLLEFPNDDCHFQAPLCGSNIPLILDSTIGSLAVRPIFLPPMLTNIVSSFSEGAAPPQMLVNIVRSVTKGPCQPKLLIVSPGWMQHTHQCWPTLSTASCECNIATDIGLCWYNLFHTIHNQAFIRQISVFSVSGQAHNFNKYDRGRIDTLEIPYDYGSIMHYREDSYSKNGKPTMRSIKDSSRPLGQNKGFTSLDVREINSLYQCNGRLS